jgi:membrane protein implicated in regulation of membrane protease activity
MRERDLAPAAMIAAIVCCGAMTLIAGLVGGVALAAAGPLTVVSAAGLCVVVAVAWQLDRRRHRHDGTCDTSDRPIRRDGMT